MSRTLTRSGASIALLLTLAASVALGGIGRTLQDRYRRAYENKALFLKLPIFAERQHVFIAGESIRPETAAAGAPVRFKVGDQVRILGLDFGGDEIRFKLSSISGPSLATLVFKFDADLQEGFPNSSVFERALAAAFTEGMKFSELDEAKRGYVETEFDRIVRDLAATSGTSREFVLKAIAPRLPAHQDALRDVDNLKGRTQDLSGQLATAQSENRRLEGELRQQHAEVGRLRSAHSALQEKIDSSSSQLSRIGDELRTSRGQAQSYQNQLANLQRSLNLKVDENRDLSGQISDLGQATRKLQKDNETLESQAKELRAHLETERATAERLAGEVDDLKTSSRQMKETIDALSSKEDSLARQYLELKKSKENLESVARTIDSLRLETLEERSEGGNRIRKTRLSLGNVELGTLEWRLPESLSANEQRTAELIVATESIDYVKLPPAERQILRSLGEKLKIGAEVSSPSSAMEVVPDRSETLQEVGERERASWRWKIFNRSAADTRLGLQVSLVNRHSDEIPVLKAEHLVASTSVVRQVRNFLQPVPLALGAVLGFLLFGIVGIFRRKPERRQTPTPAPPAYVGQKRL